MPKYCQYSFKDLYMASHPGKNPLIYKKYINKEKSQEEINAIVLKWAEKAGWYVKEVKSKDLVYLAFCPEPI